MLPLTHAVQAGTLTKLRVVDSTTSSQVILTATHPFSYRVIPLMEQKLLVIYLADTTAKLTHPLPPFTGPVIQDIRITEGFPSPPSSPHGGEMGGRVRVEVALNTSEVTFTYHTLNKPPGVRLTVRMRKASTRAGGIAGSREQEGGGITAATAMAPPDDHLRVPVVEQSPVTEHPGLRPEGDAAPQASSQESSPLTAEELKGLAGDGTLEGSLTLLELYLNHQTVFLTNPSLLWQVAATYADLALYDGAIALYTRILERADNPLVQAAARLKRGKMAMLQDDWATAETLFRQFVKVRPHGPFLGEAYEALGDALAAQGKFDGAVEAYIGALSHTPEAQKPPQMFYKLGRAQKRAGNWLKAAEAFQKAIDRLQVDTSPQDGDTLHGSRDKVHTSTAKREPFSWGVSALQQLGDSLYKAHQYQEAMTAYRGVLEGSPEDWQTAWARYHLGKSYEKLGRKDEALQAYRELMQQGDPFWVEIGYQALADMQWRGRYLPTLRSNRSWPHGDKPRN